MPEPIIIEFKTNLEGVTKAVDALEELGMVDKAAAESFRKTAAEARKYQEEMNKTGEKVGSVAIDLDHLVKAIREVPKKIIEDSAKKSLDDTGKSTAEVTEKTVRLNTQLKQMKQSLSEMELAGKANTAEYKKMALQAGALEDQIGDTSARVRVLSSDTKNLDAALSLASGIAGGFSVAQGAAALFGEENEDVQKALLKVQASLSILNGLQAIQATLNKDSAASVVLLSGAQKAYNVVVGTSVGVLRVLKIALASLGVLGVIAGLIAVINKLDLFTKSTEDAAAAQRELNQELEEAQKRENAFADILAGTNRELERQYRIRKAQGASDAELFRLKRNILQDEVESIDLALKTNATLEKRLELDERRKDVLADLQVLEAEYNRTLIKREKGVATEPIIPVLPPGELEREYVEPSIKIVEDFYKRIDEADAKHKETLKENLREIREENLRNYQEIEGYALSSFDVLSNVSQMALDNRITNLNEELAAGKLTQEEFEKLSKDARAKEAKREKTIAFFRSLMAIPEAYLEGLTQGGPPLAFFYAALAGAQSAVIAATKVPAFAEGTRRVQGGVPGKDSVHALLMPGEGVMPTDINSEYDPILTAIYKRQIPASLLNSIANMPDFGGLALGGGILMPIGADIDYDLLAEVFAKKLEMLPIHENHFDARGYTEAVRRGTMVTTYLGNRYGS